MRWVLAMWLIQHNTAPQQCIFPLFKTLSPALPVELALFQVLEWIRKGQATPGLLFSEVAAGEELCDRREKMVRFAERFSFYLLNNTWTSWFLGFLCVCNITSRCYIVINNLATFLPAWVEWKSDAAWLWWEGVSVIGGNYFIVKTSEQPYNQITG